MRPKYCVTFNLSRDELPLFLERVSPLVPKFEVTVVGEPQLGTEASTPQTPRASRAPRAQPMRTKTSKVNAAILEALQGGPATIKQMKEALEKAGRSAGSLSTGIAALTKAHLIERTSEGVYGLIAA